MHTICLYIHGHPEVKPSVFLQVAVFRIFENNLDNTADV